MTWQVRLSFTRTDGGTTNVYEEKGEGIVHLELFVGVEHVREIA